MPMSHFVQIAPSGLKYEAAENQNLLDSALAQKIVLPHACKHGACGVCKTKKTSGEIRYTQEPAPWALKDADKAAGMILTCIAEPLSDIHLECLEATEAILPPPQQFRVRVAKKEQLAPQIVRLLVQLPATLDFKFLPGQFIQFFAEDGKPRAFSIAGVENGLLELHIRRVSNEGFTEYVFSTLKEKDVLNAVGPKGTFFVREGDNPLIFLAGGTGFAPIKAILTDLSKTQSLREVFFYWGARTKADLYLNDWVEMLAKEYSKLHYVPALSEESWAGRTGLVPDVLLNDFKASPAMQSATVYACGTPAMVVAAKELLFQAGLSATNFFSDAF